VKNIRKSGFEKVDGYCKPYLPVRGSGNQTKIYQIFTSSSVNKKNCVFYSAPLSL